MKEAASRERGDSGRHMGGRKGKEGKDKAGMK